MYYDDNIRLIVSPTERDRYNIPSISEVEITESSSSDESGSEDEAEGEKESGRDETGGDREMEEDTEAGESQGILCHHFPEALEFWFQLRANSSSYKYYWV